MEVRAPMPDYPTIDELAGQAAELRPLPAAAARMVELTDGDRFSAHDLASVISSDQALTARLLRLANSAYYGFPRRITTVRDAVVLLGFRAVRSSTLVSCVIDTVRESRNIDYHQFWQFSVTTGMLAEVLARTEGMHQDHAFTAGVLHNIGQLALDQYAPDAFFDARELARQRGTTLHTAERELFGFSDADLSGALAVRWGFPTALVDAIEHHADPVAAGGADLSAFVARARTFAYCFGLPDGVEASEPQELPQEWTQPPLSAALSQAGGVEHLLERTEAFLDTALVH